MAPYVRAAEAAGYDVQFVEPWELHPEWNKLSFLRARNLSRPSTGKSIDDATLQSMLKRFEPLPPRATLQEVRLAVDVKPDYCGIDVTPSLAGQQLGTLWSLLSKCCGRVPGLSGPFKASDYKQPIQLHVTTFHHSDSDFSGLALVESLLQEGRQAQVTVEALAFVRGLLVSAVVARVDPDTAMTEGKRAHITLGTCLPCKPASSNDLLEAIFPDAGTNNTTNNNSTLPGCARDGLWRFPGLDLEQCWPRLGGEEHQLQLPDDKGALQLRAFRSLNVAGLGEVDAYLLRLPKPLVLQGRYRRVFTSSSPLA
ncbi:unnamed protein product, partial [Polarella glacialis]